MLAFSLTQSSLKSRLLRHNSQNNVGCFGNYFLRGRGDKTSATWHGKCLFYTCKKRRICVRRFCIQFIHGIFVNNSVHYALTCTRPPLQRGLPLSFAKILRPFYPRNRVSFATAQYKSFASRRYAKATRYQSRPTLR